MGRLEGGRAATSEPANDLARYRNDPVGFARDILHIQHITLDQEAAARAILEPPYRVMVKSGHNIGKTFLAAWLVNWWYETRNPSAAITSAPTKRDVEDLLWTEVRLQRQRAGLPDHFIGPSAPDMRTGPEHYAKGYTAQKGESFQGRHRPNMLFVFDEAEGVDAAYWRTAGTMFQPDGTHGFLAIFNPTTTTSQSFQEERATDADGERKWRVIEASSLNHPNILAGLRGEPLPIPDAVSLDQVWSWLGEMFEETTDPDTESDVEFPAGSGRWWKPSPDGESRVLGRRPSAGTFGVWSERLWAMACRTALPALDIPHILPEIGCDVARRGFDKTEFHVRCGPVSLHHEDHGGWDLVRTAGRLMELADEYAWFIHGMRSRQLAPFDPRTVPLKIDDTGVGGGVTDIVQNARYNAIPVNAGSTAPNATKYPRVRDELWFTTAALARQNRLDLSRLGRKRLAKLEVQALAPIWSPTPDRRRQVEPKEKTQERIGRSPDGLDALNLAFFESGADVPTMVQGGRAATSGRGRR